MGQEEMEYSHHGNGSKNAHQRVKRGEIVEEIVVDFGEHASFVGCHIRGADTEDEVIAPLKKTSHRMKTLCLFEKGNAPVADMAMPLIWRRRQIKIFMSPREVPLKRNRSERW